MNRAIRKVLVANRGEIAVRIARTCRVMGIGTAAVFSEADRGALHTRACDEAHFIGPAEAALSYLDIEKLVATAVRSGCDAVHPGYGFLSQRGDFADACAAASLAFIGPPGDVHRLMGDKQAARRLMSRSGVPVVPGYDGDDQQDATLLAEAQRIGFPVMIKPSRGGGGKGMRVVESASALAAALASARRESASSFGGDAMVLERFVRQPRHVEVQVLADSQGNIVHLHERECSLQRRHQKIVEETPSPALSETLRAELCAAGVAAARAASYVNAGTVEFLLGADGRFYFLEMNTRLQVEHPVTEAVTGVDLVRLQIGIAEGKPLPFAQQDISARGHALECRLYAEDPARGDLPSPGSVLLAAFPQGPGVRCDAGIETGATVSVHYDPLLAKIVTWGADRNESIERMSAALGDTAVLGVTTNIARLRQIVANDAFRAGAIHTGFIDEVLGALPAAAWPPDEGLAAVVAALAVAAEAPRQGGRAPVADPWSKPDGFRVGP